MMTISHDRTAMSTFKPTTLPGLLGEYIQGCKRQGFEWAFDQAAKHTPTIVMFLIGIITEATNWF